MLSGCVVIFFFITAIGSVYFSLFSWWVLLGAYQLNYCFSKNQLAGEAGVIEPPHFSFFIFSFLLLHGGFIFSSLFSLTYQLPWLPWALTPHISRFLTERGSSLLTPSSTAQAKSKEKEDKENTWGNILSPFLCVSMGHVDTCEWTCITALHSHDSSPFPQWAHLPHPVDSRLPVLLALVNERRLEVMLIMAEQELWKPSHGSATVLFLLLWAQQSPRWRLSSPWIWGWGGPCGARPQLTGNGIGNKPLLL